MTICIIYFGEDILSFSILNNVFTILINILNNIITGTPPPPKKIKNPNPKLPKVTPAPQRKKIFTIIFLFTFFVELKLIKQT